MQEIWKNLLEVHMCIVNLRESRDLLCNRYKITCLEYCLNLYEITITSIQFQINIAEITELARHLYDTTSSRPSRTDRMESLIITIMSLGLVMVVPGIDER